MKIENWMIFGTFAEQDFFSFPTLETYNGIIINANMASHAPSALAAFLLEKTNNNNYLIDPLTHSFQHDVSFIKNNGKVKSSIQKLGDKLGEPVKSKMGISPLNPSDFKDTETINNFVKSCIDFQSNQIKDYMKDSESLKYFESSESDLEPYAVIAPYFYMQEGTISQWLKINSDLIVKSREQTDKKLFASLVISKGLLVSEDTQTLIDTYSSLDVDGFIIWVDNFNEHNASKKELKGLLDIVNNLNKDGKKEVINLHGGYFSIMAAKILNKKGFTGVAHGLEYGEFRSVVPVGGGIPIAKYYIPSLFDRFKYREAARIFTQMGWLESPSSFFDNVCNCSTCKKILADNPSDNFIKFYDPNVRNVKRGSGIVRMEFPSAQAKINCLMHYLETKAKEYEFCSSLDKENILKRLTESQETFSEELSLDELSYLQIWYDVLNSYGE